MKRLSIILSSLALSLLVVPLAWADEDTASDDDTAVEDPAAVNCSGIGNYLDRRQCEADKRRALKARSAEFLRNHRKKTTELRKRRDQYRENVIRTNRRNSRANISRAINNGFNAKRLVNAKRVQSTRQRLQSARDVIQAREDKVRNSLQRRRRALNRNVKRELQERGRPLSRRFTREANYRRRGNFSRLTKHVGGRLGRSAQSTVEDAATTEEATDEAATE